MAFTTNPAVPTFEAFPFTGTAEIPAGEWTQGSDKPEYQDNPRRRVHLDGFQVGTGLETGGQY